MEEQPRPIRKTRIILNEKDANTLISGFFIAILNNIEDDIMTEFGINVYDIAKIQDYRNNFLLFMCWLVNINKFVSFEQ